MLLTCLFALGGVLSALASSLQQIDTRNHYEVLGIPTNASYPTIRRAYKAAALMFHPDRLRNNKEVEEMKLVNEAYYILSDSTTRAAYDAKLPRSFARSSQASSAVPDLSPDSEKIDRLIRLFKATVSLVKSMEEIRRELGIPDTGVSGDRKQVSAQELARAEYVIHSYEALIRARTSLDSFDLNSASTVKAAEYALGILLQYIHEINKTPGHIYWEGETRNIESALIKLITKEAERLASDLFEKKFPGELAYYRLDSTAQDHNIYKQFEFGKKRYLSIIRRLSEADALVKEKKFDEAQLILSKMATYLSKPEFKSGPAAQFLADLAEDAFIKLQITQHTKNVEELEMYVTDRIAQLGRYFKSMDYNSEKYKNSLLKIEKRIDHVLSEFLEVSLQSTRLSELRQSLKARIAIVSDSFEAFKTRI